jgi:phosphoglucosamine mutase
MQIGRAAAMVLIDENKKRPRVMIGMDTRISSNMLCSAITAGLCSVGADVMQLGVLPTPAVAFLVQKYQYDAAVMITASHNPCEYNGIKIFQADGYKLPDELEEKIEAIILDGVIQPPVKVGADVGRIRSSEMPTFDYTRHLISTVDGDFSGYKVALDCANGAASVTAPDLFTELGVDCHIKSSMPNGININRECGSTHMEGLQRYVKEYNCDVGFAFDGDADRMLAVDENGEVVDGDKVIAICAKDMKERGVLDNDTAVVTIMSNMGFFEFCKKNSIKAEKTKVGDRYVLENMKEHNYKIGGEQSGHVIFFDYASTGDGQLTALQLLSVMRRTGKKLSELAAQMEVFPQVLINVRVSQMGKARCDKDIEIKKAVESANKELGDTGRVLVRVSGTEPLVRVMLEGRDKEKIQSLAEDIAEVVKERLI